MAEFPQEGLVQPDFVELTVDQEYVFNNAYLEQNSLIVTTTDIMYSSDQKTYQTCYVDPPLTKPGVF